MISDQINPPDDDLELADEADLCSFCGFSPDECCCEEVEDEREMEDEDEAPTASDDEDTIDEEDDDSTVTPV